MIREHLTACREHLEAAGLTVYVAGAVPAQPSFPYVMLHGNAGERFDESLASTFTDFRMRLRVTNVGVNLESAMITTDRTRTALLGAEPPVPGRAMQRITGLSSTDYQVDTTVTVPGTRNHPTYQVDDYQVWSTPRSKK